MRKVVIVLIVVLAALVVLYFAAGTFVYRQLADVRGSCDKHLANRPDFFTNVSEWPVELDFSPYFVPEYEDVRFPSRQAGLEIAGWYLEGEAGAPAVIVLDGLGGCRHAQAALLPAGMLWRNGFHVLVIDLRDTGESDTEDGFSSIGNEEYLDVLGAWDWLVQEKGFAEDRVGVMGNSLGAATVLIAFEEEPRLAAIAVNSPFANLPQIMREELGRAGFPGFIAPATVIMARLLNGENLLEHDPLDAIRSGRGASGVRGAQQG